MAIAYCLIDGSIRYFAPSTTGDFQNQVFLNPGAASISYAGGKDDGCSAVTERPLLSYRYLIWDQFFSTKPRSSEIS